MKPSSLVFALLAAPVSLMAQPVAGSTGSDSIINTILAWWPYIIGLILVLLAFLWYQQIRFWMRRKQDHTRRHTARGNQLTMLALVTVFALIMLAAPRLLKRYDRLFTPKTETTMDPANRTELTLQVEGMTCTGCENAIQNRVAELPGVESVTADHMAATTVVVYDKTKTSREAIAQTITDTGYKVVD
jgi:copper chaperone CopZ/uncharacterized membrane protein YidH (DUF202 family)